jgi:tRNA-uridine 2-sulfurtransferase
MSGSGHPDKVIVGISGGVDSAVAALLLAQRGRPVAGLFMKNWEDDGSGDCRAEDDRRDALQVCARLGIAFHSANFAREYWDEVFARFLDEYRAGRTPNPDVLCNRQIKFRSFLEHARTLGAERIATGHYARVDCVDGRFRLLRARDRNKDQSYFLHALGQPALAHTLFPLGELEKPEVRRLARQAALPVHAKKDSTGICFIGERDFRRFLAGYLPARPGEIRAVDGSLLGEHAGVFYYTLGQREGLNLGGVRGRAQAPWYVVGKRVADNLLIVDQGHDSPYLFCNELLASEPSWTAGAAPARSFRASAKTRYRQADVDCEVELVDDGRLRVRFAQPQRAVTPGQSLVLYHDEECLGGAVIASTDAPLGIEEVA